MPWVAASEGEQPAQPRAILHSAAGNSTVVEVLYQHSALTTLYPSCAGEGTTEKELKPMLCDPVGSCLCQA